MLKKWKCCTIILTATHVAQYSTSTDHSSEIQTTRFQKGIHGLFQIQTSVTTQSEPHILMEPNPTHSRNQYLLMAKPDPTEFDRSNPTPDSYSGICLYNQLCMLSSNNYLGKLTSNIPTDDLPSPIPPIKPIDQTWRNKSDLRKQKLQQICISGGRARSPDLIMDIENYSYLIESRSLLFDVLRRKVGL